MRITSTTPLSPVGEDSRALWNRQMVRSALLCIAALLFLLVGWVLIPGAVKHAEPVHPLVVLTPFTVRVQLARGLLIKFGGCFLAASLLSLIRKLRVRFDRQWSRGDVAALLAVVCMFLFDFIECFGSRQFGAYDFQIVIDTGWRQSLGQRPFADFISSAPPGFDAGLKYAFKMFGASWSSVLLLTALFAMLTFLWCYWLLRRADCSVGIAVLTSFAVQSAANLTLCFWWYNNTAITVAVLFLLSCVLFLRAAPDWKGQLSLVGTAALLMLMKPNFAGLSLLGGGLSVLLFGYARVRFLLLSAASCMGAWLLLVTQKISVSSVVAMYMGVSKERGMWSTSGLKLMLPRRSEQLMAYSSLAVLCFPLAVFAVFAVRRSGPARRLKLLGPLCILATSLAISVYGLRNNGELPNLEWTSLLAAIGVFVAGNREMPRWSRSAGIVLLLTFMMSDMYLGSRRVRFNYTGLFFDPDESTHRLSSGLLEGMYVGKDFMNEQADVAAVLGKYEGPYFFGPRLDFSYAQYGLVSPPDLPIWYEPGTSFDRALTPTIVDRWRKENFRTLMFYRDDLHGGDMVYYPNELRDIIRKRYRIEQRTPRYTVYRMRPEVLSVDSTSPDGGGLPVKGLQHLP